MKRRQRGRNNKGTAMAELGIALSVMIALALFGLDCAGALISFGLNDRACRDAARAAAQGEDPVQARRLADSIVGSYNIAPSLLSAPVVQNVVYQDFNGNPTSSESPFVSVTTLSRANVLAPLQFFGMNIISGSFPVRKTYTFPIVKLQFKET